MEENKVIQNKPEEDNWVRPEYKPMPEYNPDDFKPAEFDFTYATECLKECLNALNRKSGFFGIFKIMHGE